MMFGDDEHFSKFLRDVGEFLPMVQKNGIEQAAPYLLMKFAKQMQSIDLKTKQEKRQGSNETVSTHKTNAARDAEEYQRFTVNYEFVP